MTTVCQNCGARHDGRRGGCRVCGGVALYDVPWHARDGAQGPATPLMPSRVPGLDGVLLKVEATNLSGSFKDRVMDVLVAEAVEDGVPGAVVASSGNAAVAASAACARAELPLLVLVPNAVSPNAVRLAELRGAVVVRAGEGPAAVHGLASRLSREFGLANLASTFGAAGCEWACRGIGHEISAQIGDIEVATLAASISVGPVLIGAANGLREAGRALPALVAGQAAGCAPIAEAYAAGSDEVVPWTGPAPTAALAIADRLTGYAHEATYALRQIRGSGGAVEAATDEEMREMRHALARYDGLDVELASCAAAVVLRRRGWTGPGTVCVLTGAGTKETLAVDATAGPVRTVEEYADRSGTGEAFVKEIEAWLHTSPS